MDPRVGGRRGETEAHALLKRLALIWAQANGYSACAAEVTLPRCRYRADVAAWRSRSAEITTAIFECKQALSDLRRDNCCTSATRARFEIVQQRRQTLERCLRVHYPTLRTGESLFPEYDAHDFGAIGHRGYRRVTRELAALQNALQDGTKFECITRYRCANLFYLVVPAELYRERELPVGWGALVQSDDTLHVAQKPTWHENSPAARIHILQRIAAAGTREFNRRASITRDEIDRARELRPID